MPPSEAINLQETLFIERQINRRKHKEQHKQQVTRKNIEKEKWFQQY